MKHERIAITGCHLVKVGPGTIDVDVANTESVLNLVNKTSIFQLVTASMMNHHSLFHGRLSGLCSACNRIGFSGGRCSFDSHRRGRLWVTQIIGTKFLGYILQEWTKQYWITRVVVAHLSTKIKSVSKETGHQIQFLPGDRMAGLAETRWIPRTSAKIHRKAMTMEYQQQQGLYDCT